MAEDWDLHAVVRGCSTVTSSSVSSSSSSSSGFASCYFHPEGVSSSSSSSSGFSIFRSELGSQVMSLSAYPFEARSPIEELHELCRPFFCKSQPLSLQASSPLSSLSSYSSAPPKTVSSQEKQQQQRNKQPLSVTTPRSKRRYKSSCLLCFDTPKREKNDLGLCYVVKIMSLVENSACLKVLDCGCGCSFVNMWIIIDKRD